MRGVSGAKGMGGGVGEGGLTFGSVRACWREYLVAEGILLFVINQLDIIAPTLHRSRYQLLRIEPESVPAVFVRYGTCLWEVCVRCCWVAVPNVQLPTYQSAVLAQYQCGELGLSSFASSWVPPVPGSSTMGEIVAMLPVREVE